MMQIEIDEVKPGARAFGSNAEGEFTEGTVIDVTDQEFDPSWTTYACADYGFTNPFVWLLVQIDPHGERVHILDEYYETGDWKWFDRS